MLKKQKTDGNVSMVKNNLTKNVMTQYYLTHQIEQLTNPIARAF